MAVARVRPILLVLAGGLGTRFGGLKQLEPIGPQGETLLEYAIFDAQRAGFGRVVLVVGKDFAEALRERISSRCGAQLDVSCISQCLDDLPAGHAAPAGRTRPWGTLHAVWSARATLDGPFAVINADDFYGSEAYRRVARFLAEPGALAAPRVCCMVAYALERTLSGSGGVNRGICTAAHGWLHGVVEHTAIVRQSGAVDCEGVGPDGQRIALRADALASMNIWGFLPSIVESMGAFLADFLTGHPDSLAAECYLPAFVNHAIQQNSVCCRVLQTSGSWFGITHPQDKPACVEAIRTLVDIGEYPRGR